MLEMRIKYVHVMFISTGNHGEMWVKIMFPRYNWSENPFSLKIDPKLFTGYEEQVKAALRHIESKHKIAVVTGATGAGKTHMLKWLESESSGVARLYVSKPPQKP